jgi:transposase
MSKRRHHDAAVKALKGGRTVSELAAACEVRPTMIHQGKKALCSAVETGAGDPCGRVIG